MKRIIIDGNSLTLDDLVNVARYNFPVEISKEALEKVKISRQIVDDIVEGCSMRKVAGLFFFV